MAYIEIIHSFLSIYRAKVSISNIIFLGNFLNADITKKIQNINYKLLTIKKSAHKKKAVILISLYPFYSASKYTFLGDVLEKAGFDNPIVSQVHYPLINEEELIRLNPDVIFIADRFKKELNSLQNRFQRLKINPRIIFVNEDVMSRPGPRIFDFILQINRFVGRSLFQKQINKIGKMFCF